MVALYGCHVNGTMCKVGRGLSMCVRLCMGGSFYYYFSVMGALSVTARVSFYVWEAVCDSYLSISLLGLSALFL